MWSTQTECSQLLAIPAFHLGFPLTTLPGRFINDGGLLANELGAHLTRNDYRYSLAEVDHNQESTSPLGEPLCLRRNNLDDMLDAAGLRTLCSEHEATFVGTDNRVLMFPSGVVFLLVSIQYTGTASTGILKAFEEIMEKLYSPFSVMFLEVAGPVLQLLLGEPQNEYTQAPRAVRLRDFCGRTDLTLMTVNDGVSLTPAVRVELEKVLLDVYYMHHRRTDGEEKTDVSYTDTEHTGADLEVLYVEALIYSGFVAMLWLTEHLRFVASSIHRDLDQHDRLKRGRVVRIKSLQAFCERLIQESRPIDVRLSRKYMELGERCWKEFRMFDLELQIRGCLGTLDGLNDWLESDLQAERDSRIQIAAVVLAILSAISVAADLICTLDFVGSWSRSLRLCYIVTWTVSLITFISLVLIAKVVRHRQSR